MKEQRFEKVVKWEEDSGLGTLIFCYVIVILASLGFFMDKGYGSEWAKIVLRHLYMLMIFIFSYGIYICLRERKVYWRILK